MWLFNKNLKGKIEKNNKNKNINSVTTTSFIKLEIKFQTENLKRKIMQQSYVLLVRGQETTSPRTRIVGFTTATLKTKSSPTTSSQISLHKC
jgi:hypothetical protein